MPGQETPRCHLGVLSTFAGTSHASCNWMHFSLSTWRTNWLCSYISNDFLEQVVIGNIFVHEVLWSLTIITGPPVILPQILIQDVWEPIFSIFQKVKVLGEKYSMI